MIATLTLMLLGCSVGGKSKAGKIGVGSGWVNGYSSGEVYRRTLAVGSKKLIHRVSSVPCLGPSRIIAKCIARLQDLQCTFSISCKK